MVTLEVVRIAAVYSHNLAAVRVVVAVEHIVEALVAGAARVVAYIPAPVRVAVVAVHMRVAVRAAGMVVHMPLAAVMMLVFRSSCRILHLR